MNLPMRNQRAAQLRFGSITEMILWQNQMEEEKQNEYREIQRWREFWWKRIDITNPLKLGVVQSTTRSWSSSILKNEQFSQPDSLNCETKTEIVNKNKNKTKKWLKIKGSRVLRPDHRFWQGGNEDMPSTHDQSL